LANGPAAEQTLSRGDNWNPVLDKKKTGSRPVFVKERRKKKKKTG